MNHNFYIDTIIGFGWVLFFVYWFVSATSAKRMVSFKHGNFFIFRILIFVAVLYVLNLSHQNHSFFNSTQFEIKSTLVRVVGVILFLAGLSFAIWARVNIGRNWGMPMSRNDDPELVTSGPYKYVRHPIYTGMLTAMLGTVLAVNLYWIAILITSGIYFIFSATREEKYMTGQFPKQYEQYKKHSKMLLPFIF